MSIHKSLKLKNQLVRRRNVLKRSERLEELAKAGVWDPEEDSVFGLPKVFIDNTGLVRIREDHKAIPTADDLIVAAPLPDEEELAEEEGLEGEEGAVEGEEAPAEEEPSS